MQKLFYTAQEVAEMVGVSRGQSYKIVKKLNEELEKKGFIVTRGKVPQKYFSERYYGGAEVQEEGEK